MNDKIETKNPTENLEEQANHPQENLEINASQLEQKVLQKQEEEPKPETKEVETVLATEEQTNSIPIQETKEENVEENVRVEGSPNKDFFQQTIKANVSEEIIKEKIGDLNDDWKDDRIEPVLQANDEQKIKLYDELELEEKQTDTEKELEEELRKRPDLSVSETEFYDDYARRLTIAKGKLLSDELTKEKEKVAECQEEIQKLTETIDIYLKLAKIRKYVLSKPVLTKRDAQVAIAELLEKTEKE
ncbi:10352_t:CDS:2 [Funneliformis geosporum]|nr:10352_t:CDS:2 [Funneliformis geosporum]